MDKENNQSYQVKLGVGRKLAYGLGEAGGNMSNGLFAQFFLIFCTDTFGVGAGVVGTVILLGRFWDMINDTWVGSWTDRYDSPKGKYLPWIKASVLPLFIVTILGFWAHPDWGYTAKVVWVVVLYFAWAFAFTCLNIPYTALTAVMTQDQAERASAAGYRMAFGNIVMIIQGSLLMPLVMRFGGAEGNMPGGWVKTVILFSIIGIIAVFISTTVTKEVVKKPKAIEKDKTPIMQNIRYAIKNKQFLIVAFGMFIVGFYNLGRMTSMTYFFSYERGDMGAMGSFVTAQGIGGILGALFLAENLSKLFKSKSKAVMLCTALAIIATLLQYVCRDGGAGFLIGAFFGQMFIYTALTIIFSMIADCVEYGLLKDGVRMDGFYSAFGYFWHKAGIALGSAGTGWVLAATGFVPNAATQAASVFGGINFMFFWLPIILAVLMLIAFAFYKIDFKTFDGILEQIEEKYGADATHAE